MNKKVLIIVAILAVMLIASIPASAEAPETRYVIVYETEAIPEDTGVVIAQAGGTLVKTYPQVGVAIATSSDPGFAALMEGVEGISEAGAEHYLALPDVELVQLEATEPDPAIDTYYYTYQWDIRRVYADQAWEAGYSGSHDTVVAVLDTGIAWNHPDLAPNVIYATCFNTLPSCSAYPEYHWHGTHVAGTVAAAFEHGRAVGVGPNLGLASYNVFEWYFDPVDGWVFVAFDEVLWDAMLDVAANGFEVINMSLGGYGVFPEGDAASWVAWNRMADYVTRQGVTIVASAGNGGADLNGPVFHIPGDVTGIINVGAAGIRPGPFFPQADYYDVLAFYSNVGAQVDLVAPGGDLGPDGTPYPYWWFFVFSTYVIPNPGCAATQSCPVLYAWAAGTSMASPHVAGAAGLVMDVDPGLNPHQVGTILVRTADRIGPRQLFGHGMLNVYEAVMTAAP